MLCSTLFAMQLFLGGYSQVLEARDHRMEAVVGIVEGKYEDSYKAYIATVDKATAQQAVARGYALTKHVCTIKGVEAKVYVQLKTSEKI